MIKTYSLWFKIHNMIKIYKKKEKYDTIIEVFCNLDKGERIL